MHDCTERNRPQRLVLNVPVALLVHLAQHRPTAQHLPGPRTSYTLSPRMRYTPSCATATGSSSEKTRSWHCDSTTFSAWSKPCRIPFI